MKAAQRQFLDLSPEFSEFETAAAAILPVPYEGGVSYGRGTARAPAAVIEASAQLELFDEELKAEPYRMGIVTVAPPALSEEPEATQQAIYRISRSLAREGKFTVLLGGDHSISTAHIKSLLDRFGHLSVLQLDAHTDLRDTYEGSAYSHACVLSRIRELTDNTLQIGIRSMSAEEARRIAREKLPVCTMADYRSGGFDVDTALAALPDPVFLTFDTDVLDWSVVRSTGTPEPGGFTWDEAIGLLRKVFTRKHIVGCDVVELSADEHDRNSPFAVAKLIYKMLGLKLAAAVAEGLFDWPRHPRGSLFS